MGGGADGEYNDTVMSGMHSGSVGGAAIGGSIMPGWGHLIGGMAGAVGGLFTGNRKAKREKRAREARERAWHEAQQQMAMDRYASARQTDAVVRGAYTPGNNSLAAMYGQDAALDMNKSPLTYMPDVSTRDGWIAVQKMHDNGQLTDAQYWDALASARRTYAPVSDEELAAHGVGPLAGRTKQTNRKSSASDQQPKKQQKRGGPKSDTPKYQP